MLKISWHCHFKVYYSNVQIIKTCCSRRFDTSINLQVYCSIKKVLCFKKLCSRFDEGGTVGFLSHPFPPPLAPPPFPPPDKINRELVPHNNSQRNNKQAESHVIKKYIILILHLLQLDTKREYIYVKTNEIGWYLDRLISIN